MGTLVTGAGGFVGSAIVACLQRSQGSVLGVVRTGPLPPVVFKAHPWKQVATGRACWKAATRWFMRRLGCT